MMTTSRNLEKRLEKESALCTCRLYTLISNILQRILCHKRLNFFKPKECGGSYIIIPIRVTVINGGIGQLRSSAPPIFLGYLEDYIYTAGHFQEYQYTCMYFNLINHYS